MSWQFAQDWTLNLEARYQSDRLDQGIVNGRELATTFTNFLPRAILQWQPDRDTNLYLTYAKGNKPGDFNAAVVALNDAQKAEVQAQTGGGEIVDEERLDNFEFGIKKQFAGGLVSLNIATYYMKWKNQQTRTQATVTDLTIPAGVRAVPVIISAGSTDLYGIEAEGTARITRDVTFSGTFNWAGSRYKVFDCGFCARLTGTPDMSGNQSPRFPEITATMGLAYDRTLANDLGVFGRVDAIYNSGAFTEAFNFARNRDTARVNVRAGVQKDAWRLELFVINLFNNKDYISAARFTDFTKGNFNLNDFVVNVTPADPRQLGVRVRVQL
jgi:iron complex outermembrane receptor protein